METDEKLFLIYYKKYRRFFGTKYGFAYVFGKTYKSAIKKFLEKHKGCVVKDIFVRHKIKR